MQSHVDTGYDGLPLDRSMPVTSHLYPRDPAEYTPLDHFVQRFKEPRRFLDGDIIEEAISEGEFRDNEDGLACFRLPKGGVSYYILAGYHQDGYRVLVTGWPHLHSRHDAIESGYWSSRELDTIEQLNSEYNESLADNYTEYVQWSKEHTA